MPVWEYAAVKPKEQIEMSAQVSMDARIAAKRELLSTLSLEQMEELAAESQALVDRITTMAKANMHALLPVSTTSPPVPVDGPASSS